MYIYIYICICICMCVCVCMYRYIYLYLFIYTWTLWLHSLDITFIYIPITTTEQNSPVKFAAHLQENDLTASLDCSIHVPPFRHGSDEQGSSAKQQYKIF